MLHRSYLIQHYINDYGISLALGNEKPNAMSDTEYKVSVKCYDKEDEREGSSQGCLISSSVVSIIDEG